MPDGRKGLYALRVAVMSSLLLLFGCTAWRQQEVRIENASDPLRVFGNPSNATADASNRNNYLLTRAGYVLSYNDGRGTANWIAWRTAAADLGEGFDRPDFEPDQSLPAGFVRVFPSDYSGSGYDRGHMVPSADRFGGASANAETFLMTNVVPQTPDLNQNVWEKLERYSRSLVRRGNVVYTIAGVYGEQGRLKGKVTVPTNCWKVAVVFRSYDLAVRPDTRVIAVDIPNRNGIADDNWRKYLTTVRAIEQRTGYDFFASLPREIQDAIETRTDNNAGRPVDERDQ